MTIKTTPLVQPLDAFGTSGMQPRLLADTRGKTLYPDAIRAQIGAMALASALRTDIGKSDSQLGDGTLTPIGAARARQGLARNALARLDAEIMPQVVAAERAAQEAGDAITKTRAQVLGGLSPFDLAAAQATAAWYRDADLPDRQRFAADVRNGVREAVVAASLLPSYTAGGLAEIAREKLVDSAFPPERRGDHRRVSIAARVVRIQCDDLRASIAALVDKGEIAPPSARELLDRGNDATLSQLIAEGEALGALVPRATSSGTPAAGKPGGPADADPARNLFVQANS